MQIQHYAQRPMVTSYILVETATLTEIVAYMEAQNPAISAEVLNGGISWENDPGSGTYWCGPNQYLSAQRSGAWVAFFGPMDAPTPGVGYQTAPSAGAIYSIVSP